MAEDLRELERWLAQMVQNLTPGERMRALRRMGGALGTSTGRRIAAQQNPDGSAFVPRKKGKPRRTGQPKSGPMFRRLRMARFLRKQVDQDRLSISFAGGAERIARPHQLGLRGKVNADGTGPEYTYPRRQVLGMTDADMDAIRTIALDMVRGK